MANIYVSSPVGSDAFNGSTWLLAKATLAGAAAIDAAGDIVWVSQAHAETTAAQISPNFAGTVTSPVKIMCGNDGAAPPTALATTATVSTTGNSNINIIGSYLYIYGIDFRAGVGASGTAQFTPNGHQWYDTCKITLATTGGGTIQPQSSDYLQLKNCTLKWGATNQGIGWGGSGAFLHIKGGSVASGTTTPTNLFTGSGTGCRALVEGFDMTNLASTVNLGSIGSNNMHIVFRDCKLPASWSGSLTSATPGARSIWEMFNCDSGDTHYRYRRSMAAGTIQEETTVVRTGGASDGTTTYSLKLVTNANAEYPIITLDTPERAVWNDTVGSSVTLTVPILHDSVTNLKDDEAYIDVLYLGTSGFPLGAFIQDSKADWLAAAANQASSSVTWTTTGLTNPNKQELSVTFTPQEVGYIHYVVRMAKASYTMYVDLKAVLS